MKNIRIYLSAALLVGADRITKALFREADRVLIPGILALRGTRNTGIAFGLLAGRSLLLPILAAAVLCTAIVLFLRGKRLRKTVQYGLGLLLGGALGNLADRILLGYVIDFIDPVFLNWFVFNLADAGVTCGAALLMICLLFSKEDPFHDACDR